MKEDYQKKNEAAESELSKKMFHLKTLCDVSRVLLDQENIDGSLRNFLLMMLGSFGVVEGFMFVDEEKALIPKKLVTVGIDEEMIRKYVRWQEQKERDTEPRQGKLLD